MFRNNEWNPAYEKKRRYYNDILDENRKYLFSHDLIPVFAAFNNLDLISLSMMRYLRDSNEGEIETVREKTKANNDLIRRIVKERNLSDKIDALVKADVDEPKALVNQKWYEGGTLYNENALAWQSASEENKLATCADLVAVMYEKKMFVEPINAAVHTVEDFRPLAEELVIGLNGAFKKDPDEEKNKMLYTNQKVNETAVILVTMMGWI